MITLSDFDAMNNMQQDGLAKNVAELYLSHLTTDEFAELWIRVKTSRLGDIVMRYLGQEVEISGDRVTILDGEYNVEMSREEFMRKCGHLMG